MSKEIILVLVLIALNMIIGFLVFLYGMMQKKEVRTTYLMLSWFILFVPILGVIYLIIGSVITFLKRKKYVDMSEVSFSQDRDQIILPPDEESELNYVPIEDAIAVSDTTSLRRLVLDTLRNSSLKSISYLSACMNSKDSETSHYAASIIMDILSECRSNAQQMLEQMQKNPEDVEISLITLEYIYDILSSDLMNDIEQKTYIYLFDMVGENLFTNNLWYMTETHYLWLTDMLLSIKDYNLAQKWVKRGSKYRPNLLDTYKAILHLYFEQRNVDSFFSTLEELKKSDIVVDDEVLNLFRIYQRAI